MAAVDFEPFEFEARVEEGGGNLGWLIAVLPFDSLKKFGTKKNFNVRISLGGKDFPSTLFPTGTGHHYLMITNAMKGTGLIQPGVPAVFGVENDPVPREVPLTPRFEAELETRPDLAAIFFGLSPSHRRSYLQHVEQAKTEPTRAKRLELVFTRLEEIRLKKASR